MLILAFAVIIFCFMSIHALDEKQDKDSSKQSSESSKNTNELLILNQNNESNREPKPELSKRKTNTAMSKYLFTDKDQLVQYLYQVLRNPTIVKVQKTLYLIFAYYGASYGQLEESAEFLYPPYLFEANFVADKHGPLDPDVLEKQLSEAYSKEMTISQIWKLFLSPEKENIKDFIQNIVDQVNRIDDWHLVNITKQDQTWQNAHPYHAPMLKDYIIQEYIPRI